MPGRLFIEEHSTGRKEKVLLKLHNFSQNSSCLMSSASTQSNELAKLGKLRREYCIRVTLNRCITEIVNILCLVTLEGVLKTFKYAQPLDKNLTPY